MQPEFRKKDERLRDKNNDKDRIKNMESFASPKKAKKVKVEGGGELKVKKKREEDDHLEESEEAKVTLSLHDQFELLKYHKRSKNYFGTAKQFGITHQQARAVVKIHKEEFKKLPSY